MILGYVHSRFPVLSEVWVVREMDGVEAAGHRVEPVALFGDDGQDLVQDVARRWIARLGRPTLRSVLASLTAVIVRHPLRFLATLAVAWRYVTRPAVFLKAVVTLLQAPDVARRMQRAGVDHVHAHFGTYPALSAWAVRRLAGLPYSFTVHAHDLYVHRLHLADKVRDARFVVAISGYNASIVEGLGEDTPVHVVHCGVDLSRFTFAERPRPRGPATVLCVAGLREKKGHRHLIAALAAADGGGFRLRLVGEGPEREALEGLARDAGVAHRIEFVGNLPEDGVHAEMAAADVFVLPSVRAADGDTEGIPVVLMEAMASGVPVVATDLTGVGELVSHERTGLLVAPGDAGALVQALNRTIEDWEATRQRVRAARRLVESEFDASRSAQTLAALFARTQREAAGTLAAT